MNASTKRPDGPRHTPDFAGLWDGHCHTEYAHCATTTSAELGATRSLAAGLDGVALTEHAFALYVTDPDAAWSWRWQAEPEYSRAIWRAGRGRMDEYRAFARRWRGERVRLGLEVDLLADGELALAPEDRAGWDLLVGAVHAIPGADAATPGDEADRLFMRAVERLADHGVDVLAHPFRWYAWTGARPAPKHLYAPVAAVLARHGVAAEINFHAGNPNDLEFFRLCLERGAKLSLGSDAHAVEEIGDFARHVEVLRALGLAGPDWGGVLYRPPPEPKGEGGETPYSVSDKK